MRQPQRTCPFPSPSSIGGAEQLPVETGTAAVVVCSEVLCSVAEPASVLAEIRRVFRQPGGELRVYEHVLATRTTGTRYSTRRGPRWMADPARWVPHRERYLRRD
ncbi:MAG: class I SAM-dependent methyltransferase [Actinobacteria bacterium]|nr:class I SAM-dependent methyltransferase [Actinomycetota bacterium]